MDTAEAEGTVSETVGDQGAEDCPHCSFPIPLPLKTSEACAGIRYGSIPKNVRLHSARGTPVDASSVNRATPHFCGELVTSAQHDL